MTTQAANTATTVEQGALFGDPASLPADSGGMASTSAAATQDVELVASVVRLAQDPGYRLVERSGRVFRVEPARTGAVEEVPRYEADTVTQLLDGGLLELGGTHTISYRGHEGPARSVLVPRRTRDMATRWGNLRPLPARRRPNDPAQGNGVCEGVPASGAAGQPTRWCPECGEPAQAVAPTTWTGANGPRPHSSHTDGTPLCPVMTSDGYRPARLSRRRPQ